MDRIFQMILNTVLRQLLNRGIKSGIDYAARGGQPAAALPPDERTRSLDAKAMAKRARQAANLAKRLGR